jgi:tetratricopeptide (TPR) repeat protein
LFNLSLQHMYNISINDDVKSLAVYLMDLAIFLGVLRLSIRNLSSKTTNFWRMTVISVLTFVALISVSVPATVRLKQGEWKKPAFLQTERYDRFEYKYYHYKRGADVREFSGNKYVAFNIGLLVVIVLTLSLAIAVLTASPWSGGNRMRQDLATVMGVILLYYSGLNLHRMNQWQTQGDIWTSTIRTDPTSQRAYVNYGVYLVLHKELDKAEWYYARAAQINPLNPTLWYNLGQLYLRMNDFEGAEYSFTQTLKLDPKNTSARLNLANIYVLANRQDDALNQYQTIVKIDPQNARAYYNIAVLLQNRGDLGGALDNCKKALALRPDFDKARDMCGSNAP